MKRALAGLAALALGLSLAVWSASSEAADHLDAPAVKKDGRTDITDIYAFKSKQHPGKTVLIMDVNPLAGVVSGTTFDPKATYEFLVDNNNDAEPDAALRVNFSRPGPNNGQAFDVTYQNQWIGRGRTRDVTALKNGSVLAWAGLADDPFFFDLQAFKDQVKGAGGSRTFCDGNAVDFFAGTNITAIVLEVPSSFLTAGSSTVGVWGRTTHNGAVIDQMGRPAINTVFVPDNMKDQFNNTRPNRMRAAFGTIFTDDLLALSGLDGTPYTQQQAQAITNVLLPDVLTVDTASAAGFLNGRQPSDDVIDAELGVVTGGFFGGTPVLTTDCINGNDVALPQTFPYLAAAH